MDNNKEERICPFLTEALLKGPNLNICLSYDQVNTVSGDHKKFSEIVPKFFIKCQGEKCVAYNSNCVVPCHRL